MSSARRALVRGFEAGRSTCGSPDGSMRRFGSAARVADLTIHSDALLPAGRDAGEARRSASRTRPANGTPTTSWRFFELLLRNAAPAARAACGLATAPRGTAAPEPAERLPPRPAQHRLPLRPRQRPLRAHARRDDDLLLRRLRAADEPLADAQRRKLRRICEKLRLVRTTACSRSAAAGAASRGSRRREYGGSVTGADDLARSRPSSRAGGSRGRPRRPREILEEDYREPRGHVHQGRLDRDARGDRREPVRDLLRRLDRLLEPGGVACVQTILIPDDALASAIASRPTGSSATSSPAA